MPVGVYSDAATTDLYTFLSQAKRLVQSRFARKQDPAARAHHPMPGHAGPAIAQRPNDLPSRTWIARSPRYIAVGRN